LRRGAAACGAVAGVAADGSTPQGASAMFYGVASGGV